MYLGFPFLSFDFCVSLDLCVGPSGVESDDISQNPFPTFSEVDGQGPLIQEGFSLTTLKKGVCFSSFVFCLSSCAEAEVGLISLSPF